MRKYTHLRPEIQATSTLRHARLISLTTFRVRNVLMPLEYTMVIVFYTVTSVNLIMPHWKSRVLLCTCRSVGWYVGLPDNSRMLCRTRFNLDRQKVLDELTMPDDSQVSVKLIRIGKEGKGGHNHTISLKTYFSHIMTLFIGAVVVNSHTTCHYNGKVYDIGVSFNSSDGCNICHCDRFGFASCTERACLNGTYNYNSIPVCKDKAILIKANPRNFLVMFEVKKVDKITAGLWKIVSTKTV